MEVFAWVILFVVMLVHTHDEVPAVLVLEEVVEMGETQLLYTKKDWIYAVEDLSLNVEPAGVLLEDISFPEEVSTGCYVLDQHLWCPVQI